jgi:hypothetical protein
MSPLLSELMLVCGTAAGVIERIEIDPNFAVLRRGEQSLSRRGDFRLADHYTPRGFAISF